MASPKANIPIIGIYKITSPTGRVYIGQSWDIRRRWRYHKNDIKADGLLQRSLKKHGFSSHRFDVLASLPSTATQEVLNDLERFFIQDYRSRGIKLLNLTEGGYNARLTDEHKDKIRQALTGYVQSEKHRLNISRSRKGFKHTEEHKLALSKRMKGRPALWLRGKKLSPEHLEKIQVGRRARRREEEEHDLTGYLFR